MREFWVEGADRETGAEITIVVTAANEEAAAEEARGRGLLVSSVKPRAAAPTANYRTTSTSPSRSPSPASVRAVAPTGWIMSGVIAAGSVAAIAYAWTVYVVVRLVAAAIEMSRTTGGTQGGVGDGGRPSLFDMGDALAFIVVPFAVPIVIAVLFHCFAVGLYGLRARLLALPN